MRVKFSRGSSSKSGVILTSFPQNPPVTDDIDYVLYNSNTNQRYKTLQAEVEQVLYKGENFGKYNKRN